ncbi:hypothetical protein [Kribbella sp. NPDC055071]
MAGPELDKSSAAYRQIQALISAAHRTVGAGTPWWNGTIKRLGRMDTGRSRTDLDGTILLHRNVIKELGQAVGRTPQEARNAAYDVVSEALRTAGPHDLSPRPGNALDKSLPANPGKLDRALAAERAAQLTESVMAAAGMSEAYLASPIERTDAGRGLPADRAWSARFAADPELALPRAGVRGLVDRLAEARDEPLEQARAHVYDELIRSPKANRWITAINSVAEARRPGLHATMEAMDWEPDQEDAYYAAGRQWARINATEPLIPARTGARRSGARRSGADASAGEQAAYQVGRDTGGVLVLAADAAVRSVPGGPEPEPRPVEAASPPHEVTPAELLAAQTPPATNPSGAAPTASTYTAAAPDPGKTQAR